MNTRAKDGEYSPEESAVAKGLCPDLFRQDAAVPQALAEYNAAIAGCRLEHLIACKARDYVTARWRNDGTAAGHYRTLEKLVREFVR